MSYNYVRKKVNIPQVDGTTKRMDIYAHSKEELEEKINEAIEKAEKEIERALNPTFKKVSDDWINYHESDISYYTYCGYKAPLKDLQNEFGSYLLKDITPIQLQRFINELGKQGYAKHTIALRKIVASQIFDYGILKGYIQTNPTLPVKIPKNAKINKRELPSDADIETVKQSVDLPFGLFPYFILYSGCRRGEALALTYEDIDFKSCTISINKVVVFENGKPVIYNRAKSKDGIRTIPLLKPLQNVLNHKGTGYIFNNDGRPLTLSEFNILWSHYIKATQVKLSPHQLRHAFATICFDAGLSPKDASQILGHSKVELTLDVYTHIRLSRTQETTEKLNTYLNGML